MAKGVGDGGAEASSSSEVGFGTHAGKQGWLTLSPMPQMEVAMCDPLSWLVTRMPQILR